MIACPLPPTYEDSLNNSSNISDRLDTETHIHANYSIEFESLQNIIISQDIVDNDNIINAYSLCKFIQCICIINSFISVLFYVTRLTFFIPTCLFILSGYIGALKYNKYLLIIYSIYEILYIIFNFYIILQVTYISYAISYSILNIVLSFWYIVLCIKCINFLNKLTDDEINMLKEGYIPKTTNFILM